MKIKVKAKSMGFNGEKRILAGQEFEIDEKLFSQKWMEKVDEKPAEKVEDVEEPKVEEEEKPAKGKKSKDVI